MKILERLRSFLVSESLSHLHNIRISNGRIEILASRAGRESYKDLWDAEVKVFSQWGEDGILWFLCDALNIDKPRMLEIGSGNFTECNSRFLAEARNAAVFLVDSRTDLVATIDSLDLRWKNNLEALETWVTPKNAFDIYSKAIASLGRVDILSLDIDGIDYWVMSEIDLTGISIIVVEYNPIFGAKYPITVPRSEFFDRTSAHYSWLFFGASLKAWEDLFASKGFSFVGTNRVGNNAFFVSRDSENVFNFVQKPDSNLSRYVDWQVRESRNEQGELNFLDLKSARDLISDCEIALLSNSEEPTLISIKQLGDL